MVLLTEHQKKIYKLMDSQLSDACDQGHPEATELVDALIGDLEDNAYIEFMETGRYLEDGNGEGSQVLINEWWDTMYPIVENAIKDKEVFNVDDNWHLVRRMA